MDGEGLTPEALDKAASESGARAAYVQPFQNPTARVMSLQRRRDIVAVARKLRLILIEDDLYGPHVAELGLPPLAQLAPDVVAYVSGLSKSLSPGFRTGFLAMPAPLPRRRRSTRCAPIAFGSPTSARRARHGMDRGRRRVRRVRGRSAPELAAPHRARAPRCWPG